MLPQLRVFSFVTVAHWPKQTVTLHTSIFFREPTHFLLLYVALLKHSKTLQNQTKPSGDQQPIKIHSGFHCSETGCDAEDSFSFRLLVVSVQEDEVSVY